jgi:nicotinamidase-related amidase
MIPIAEAAVKTALLVIDIQNDYFPGGRMELRGPTEAAERAAALIARFRAGGLPVTFIQHIARRPDATFFLPGTEGVAIHPSVAPLDSEPVIEKHYPNAFRETHLLEDLRSASIEQVVIAGMMTHMCIDATTRAAFDFGFECLIASDACATRDLTLGATTIPAAAVHHAFLAALNGTYGRVTTAAEVAAAV